MRSRWALPTVLAAVAAVVLSACGSGRPGPPPASVGLRLDRPLAASIASLPLTDDAGRSTDLGALRGRDVVLTDVLTLCQDVCPLTSADFAVMDRAVAAARLTDKVQFVELTVDPGRDSPARLHAYRRLFDAPANWSLLTGSPQVVAQIWSWFHVYYHRVPEDSPPGVDWWTGQTLTYDVDHEDVLAFLDTDEHERFVIDGLPNAQGRPIPPSLHAFLSDLGRQHLARPSRAAWTVPQALGALSWLVGTPLNAP